MDQIQKPESLPSPENLIGELEQIKKELDECVSQRNEYLGGWQRAKADYINFRNANEQFMEEFRKYAQEDILLELIGVADSFDILIKHHSEELNDNEWGKGILQIKNQLENILRSRGAEEVGAEGENFKPEFHEALETIEAADGEDGKIKEVLRKGYRLRGKIIRPAGVKVLKSKIKN